MKLATPLILLTAALVGGGLFLGCDGTGAKPSGAAGKHFELLNVSYDPTRELWKEVNSAFSETYEKETGNTVSIKQSHGGSSSQARAVIDGLEADVVSLALWSDVDQLRRKGLIKDGWERRYNQLGLPYTSTIVFVVRKGNPKQIQDWPDLVRPDVQIITPNPKTSGNGKLAFLAAWGSVVLNKGSDDEARDYITKLYKQVPQLDNGARQATTTFAQKKIGDVHLTWENEAHLEVKEAKGELEIVYPKLSILAEPYVSVVEANAEKKGTFNVADAYLKYLSTERAQRIIASHFYRPRLLDILEEHREVFHDLKLFKITDIVKGWDEAQEKFFAEGALFDSIYQAK